MRRGEFVSVYFSLLSCSVSEEDSSVRLLGLRDRTVSGLRDISHSVYLEVGLSPLSPQQGYFLAVYFIPLPMQSGLFVIFHSWLGFC